MLPHQELFAEDSLFNGPTVKTPTMAAAEPAPGPLNNAGDDGEDEDNRYFLRTLKFHYIEHQDDNLLVSLVENGQFNEHLALDVRERLRVALRKHVLALAQLRATDPNIELPTTPNTDYINSAAILRDTYVHNLSRGMAQKADISLNIAHWEANHDIYKGAYGMADAANVEIEELLDDPAPPVDEMQEAENDDDNVVFDGDIDVADLASTISNYYVPADALVVVPVLPLPFRNSSHSNNDNCPSPVPSWHDEESIYDDDSEPNERPHQPIMDNYSEDDVTAPINMACPSHSAQK